MATRVQIAFDLSANGVGSYFTLDDPVKGVLAVIDQAYVALPGASGNYLSVPDSAALDITGDIDIRVRVAMDDWTPAGPFIFLSKTNITPSYWLRLETSGVLRIGRYQGAVSIEKSSTVATGIADGAAKWIRATMDADNGAGGNEIKFWTADDDGTGSPGAWTQLGTTVTTAGIASIDATTSIVQIGTGFGTNYPMRLYRAQILNGIDGPTVLDVDTSVLTTTTATSFAAVTGQTVTINKSGSPGTTIVLPASDYLLAGDVLVDVTSSVRALSIKRGRSRQLDRFVAGSSNLVIDNRNRYFDPTNSSSPYYGSVVPGKQITIDRDGVELYVGNVADWNFQYDLNGDATALPSCTDGFAYMANQVLTAGSATAQYTGARISSVLTAINWPIAQRSIATGQAMLDGDFVPDGTNALAYLQKVGDYSEPGAFFISRDGLATFKDRAQLQAYTSGISFGTTNGSIPYVDFAVVYGIEEMTNAIEVTYTAGTVTAGTAIASSATSQAKYGILDSKVDTVLGSLADAQALADWQVSLYSEPQYRVDSITVNLDSLSASQIASILAIDLGDAVSVTPPNGSVAQIVSIDGIEHNATPQQHLVTFTMSETLAAFILDSAIFGILDTSVLGF